MQMFEKHRKRRGSASAFGLALLATLACGAFMASAAQAGTWKVEGKPFGATQSFVAAGTFNIELYKSDDNLECGATGSGEIENFETLGYTLLTLECEIEGWEDSCAVYPAPFEFYAEDAGQAPTLESISFKTAGESCPWSEEVLNIGAFKSLKLDPIEFGGEAEALQASMQGEGSYGKITSSTMTWYLTGANTGDEWTYSSEAPPTPPSATTGEASAIGIDVATLNGTVNPQGNQTSYQIEYGKTTSYGSKVPASLESVGSGSEAVEVSEEIAGLSAYTTYHYRVSATNEYGQVNLGKDQTFTTDPPEGNIWHIDGSPFGGSRVIHGASGGAITIKLGSYTLQCGQALGSEAWISGFDVFEALIELSCEIKGWEATCDVEPVELPLYAEDADEAPEPLETVVIETSGKSCPWSSKELSNGIFFPLELSPLKFGPEQVLVPLTIEGEDKARGTSISGTATWEVDGPGNETWGYHPAS